VGLSAHLKWPSLLMSAGPTSQATRLRTQTRQYPDGGPQLEHARWQKTAQANSPDFGSAFEALLVHGGRFSPPTNSRSSGRFRRSSRDRDHRDVDNKLYAAVGVQCDRVTGACCGGHGCTCTAQHRAAALCPHNSGMRCHHCSKRVVAFRRACACLRIWVGAHVYVCACMPVRECDQARGRALRARACAWLRVWVGVHGYLCARTCTCAYLRECGRVSRTCEFCVCMYACERVCTCACCAYASVNAHGACERASARAYPWMSARASVHACTRKRACNRACVRVQAS
jgi:hypothetical protein